MADASRTRRTRHCPTGAEKNAALAGQAPLDGAPAGGVTRPAPPASIDKAKGLRVRYRPLATLIPYARNARQHPERQIAQIAGSIREFGFTAPVLLDGENGILAGHGRVLAAERVGLARVPTIDLAHLDEAQRRAYILADNRLPQGGKWDTEMLLLEVADLSGKAFDVRLLGFSDGELDEFLGRNGGDLGAADGAPAEAERSHRQMAFTLPRDQAERVKAALKAAKEEMAPKGSTNGGALALICERFLASRTPRRPGSG